MYELGGGVPKDRRVKSSSSSNKKDLAFQASVGGTRSKTAEPANDTPVLCWPDFAPPLLSLLFIFVCLFLVCCLMFFKKKKKKRKRKEQVGDSIRGPRGWIAGVQRLGCSGGAVGGELIDLKTRKKCYVGASGVTVLTGSGPPSVGRGARGAPCNVRVSDAGRLPSRGSSR